MNLAMVWAKGFTTAEILVSGRKQGATKGTNGKYPSKTRYIVAKVGFVSYGEALILIYPFY